MATMVANNMNQRRERLSSSIAMIMALVSFSMLFATLLMGYVAYRFTADVWPPMGMEKASLTLPTISSVIIFLSSLSYMVFERSFLKSETKKLKVAFFVTFGLGMAFLICQLFLWENLQASGIYVDTTVFASIIYAFTWVHAAHVAGGVLAYLFLIPTLRGTREQEKSYLWVTNVGKYWHFLGIVWFIIYFSIFIF